MPNRREQLILLNLVPGVSSACLRRLLEAFGDLDRLWAALPEQLAGVERLGPELARRLDEGRRDAPRLARELEQAQALGVEMVTLDEADYPALLRELADPPLALYIRGRLPLAGDPAVALVGARRASLYGLQVAERLAGELAQRGIVVVSGLAEGIDAAAHRGALKAAGRTVAVVGTGLDQVYPPEHADLAARIAGEGALVSEYPFGTPPSAMNFPRRNRLISGLSLGVVVVEAGPRSGALITAGQALEQGREVFAVPGPVTSPVSQGTHQLLKEGARLVTSVEDILEELRLEPVDAVRPPGPPVARAGAGASPAATAERAGECVLACLQKDEAKDIDTISEETGLSAAALPAVLLRLELARRVRQLPGKRFMKPWS